MWFLIFILVLAVLAGVMLVVTRGPHVHGDPDLGRPRRPGRKAGDER
jgi:hypothetical protein